MIALLFALQVLGGDVLTGVAMNVTVTSPTSSATYDAGEASSVALGGISSSDRGVRQCSYSNSLGGSGSTSGTTSWSATVSLTVGTNVVTVSCTDNAGTTGFDIITVTRGDVTAPTVTITSPTSSSTYDAGTSSALTTFAGTSSDNVGVSSCTWASNFGSSGSTSGTTSWSVSSIPLSVGSNILTVTCSDAAGNMGTDTLTVTRSSSGSGTEYFVDNSCANDGNGTVHTCASSAGGNGAWNALSSARGIAGNTCAAGDTIKIKVGSGAYISTNDGTDPSEDGGFHITCTAAISGSPYTLTAYDTANPPTIANCALSSTTQAACNNATITKTGSVDYITLSYLKVFGGIWLTGVSTTVEASLPRGVTLSHNEIYQGWGESDGNHAAFFCAWHYGVQFDHNYIHDIDSLSGAGDESSGAAVKLFTCTNSIYEYNTIDGVDSVIGTTTTQAGCFDDKQDSVNNTFRYNLCLDVPHGFRIQNQTTATLPYNAPASGTVVEHNVVRITSSLSTGNCLRFADSDISSFTFRNNTCYGTFAGDAAITSYIDTGETLTGFQFYNNIIIGTPSKHVLLFGGKTFSVLDYNIWDSGASGDVFRVGGTNYTSLANLVSGTAFEDHGQSVSSAAILFTNASTNDFTLQALSPAQSAGYSNGTGSGGSVVDVGAYTDSVTCLGYTCS